MQLTVLLRLLLRSRCLLARRGHGGAAQTRRELERLALLEQSTLQPVAVRAHQAPAAAPAAAAAYLREQPERVDRVRAALAADAAPLSSASAGASSAAPGYGENASPGARVGVLDQSQVSSLTQFLSRCKQLKIQYSSDSDADARRQGRTALCAFWAHHASSAVACCYQGVREIGFVADYGLADTGMHLDLRELWTMLRVLKAESAVASSFDATRTLQYLARELQYMERGQQAASQHRRGMTPASTAQPSPADLLVFRQSLTDLAVDLLAFYFVLHSPLVSRSTQLATRSDASPTVAPAASPASPSSSSGVAIATANDALSGLEVLAVLSAEDASHDTITKLWERRLLSTLRRQREPAVVAAAQTAHTFSADAAIASSSAALAHEVHYLLVAELFRFAAVQRHDLRLTDIVHAFALLRVHLRTLWPPYARYHNGSTATTSHPSSDSGPPSPAQRLPLWYEKDILFRVSWGLVVALVSKDRKLINPYHYVKIVTVLAKLPAFVLSPTPVPKKELRRLELLSKAGTASGEAAPLSCSAELHDEELSALMEIPPEQRPRGHSADVEENAPHAHRLTLMDNVTTTSGINGSSGETNAVALQPVDFWRFIVAKACVFVPNLPPEERRVVCRSLHLAITEKRGHLLRDEAQQRQRVALTSFSSKFGRAATVRRAVSAQRGAEVSDDAADVILPLVEEMATYPENYDACIRATRRPAQSYEGHRDTTEKWRKRGKR